MSNDFVYTLIECGEPAPPDMTTSLLEPEWIRRFRERAEMALADARKYRDDLWLPEDFRHESRQSLMFSLRLLAEVINEAETNREKCCQAASNPDGSPPAPGIVDCRVREAFNKAWAMFRRSMIGRQMILPSHP